MDRTSRKRNRLYTDAPYFSQKLNKRKPWPSEASIPVRVARLRWQLLILQLKWLGGQFKPVQAPLASRFHPAHVPGQGLQLVFPLFREH